MNFSLTQLVFLTVRVHLFPFRTQKLSSPVPKILVWRRTGKIGQCQHKKREFIMNSLFFFIRSYTGSAGWCRSSARAEGIKPGRLISAPTVQPRTSFVGTDLQAVRIYWVQNQTADRRGRRSLRQGLPFVGSEFPGVLKPSSASLRSAPSPTGRRL